MNLRTVAITTLSAVAVLTTGVIALLPTTPTSSASSNLLLLENISYVHGNELIGPVDILIEDGRISTITATSEVIQTNDAASSSQQNQITIDGAGLVAVAGLIDAHTHSYGSALEDGLKFGVTATLDMASHVGFMADMTNGRDDYTPTDRTDMYSAGMMATAPEGHGTQFGMPIDTLVNADEVDAWVAARVEEGSDYIKLVYMPYQSWAPSIDLEIARAVIEAAHKYNKKAVAHIHTQQGALELLQANVDGFVHMFADSPVRPDFIKLAQEKQVFFVPTLAVLAAASGRHAGTELIEDAAFAAYLSASQKQQLMRTFDYDIGTMEWQTAFQNTALLAAAGIPILAGSDAPNPGTTAGASLHHEMSLLVEAGLSHADALAGATTLAATHFSLQNRGSIAHGNRADLLLLSENPLESIASTRAIQTLIKNGQVIERGK